MVRTRNKTRASAAKRATRTEQPTKRLARERVGGVIMDSGV
jgi:hypothetical protein